MKIRALSLAVTAFCAASHSNHCVVDYSLDNHYAAQVSPTENAPIFSVEKLYNLTTRFHDTFIYPANLIEANKINSTIFSEDCQGNIDITRTFVGRELNTEYVFGSFASVGKTQSLNLLGVPQSWNLTHWTGYQNNVNFAVTFQMYIPVLNITLPLEIWTWLSFNSKGEISQYDTTFRYIDSYVQTILTQGAQVLKATSPQLAMNNLGKILANNICATAQSSCTGSNVQYASYQECYNFLTSGVIPLGQPYQSGQNTILCRMIHQPMVSFRPDVHCPHIGPTGGAMCVNDITYVQQVEGPSTFFTNAPWLPRFPESAGHMRTTGGPFQNYTKT